MRVIAHQPTDPLQDHPVLVIERRALDRDRDLTGRQPRFVDCLDARRHLAALLVQYQRAESAHSFPPPLTDPTRDGSLLPARTTSRTCAAAKMIDFSDHGIPALPNVPKMPIGCVHHVPEHPPTISPVHTPAGGGESVTTQTISRAPLERTIAAAPAERAAAVFLWLGHPRLPLLRRLFAAGAGGRHVVDLCRTADPRIRLVACRPLGGSVVGRRARGADLASDRSARRPVRFARRTVPRG